MAVSNFKQLKPVHVPPLEAISSAVAKRCAEVPQINAHQKQLVESITSVFAQISPYLT